MMEVARQCCFAAESTPVIVDCDTGYGDTGSVAFVLRQYVDSTAVAAICIEDKVFPKRNAMDDLRSQGLEPPEVLEAKLAAGRVARGSSARPLLIARTEALVFHAGVDEAVQRLVRYAAAGAEALLIQSTAPLDYLLLAGLRAKQATGLPVVAVPTSFPDEPATTFWDAGFDVVVRSHQLLQAAVSAQAAVLGPLLDGSLRPRDLPVQLTDHAHINVRRV
jgi:phosphoenolpyruvate phosphomutase